MALDLRGYGESDDFKGPMNFFDVADDIYKLISYQRKSVMLLDVNGCTNCTPIQIFLFYVMRPWVFKILLKMNVRNLLG